MNRIFFALPGNEEISIPGNAYSDLLHAGINEVVTCNTILHETNKINIDKILADGILQAIC